MERIPITVDGKLKVEEELKKLKTIQINYTICHQTQQHKFSVHQQKTSPTLPNSTLQQPHCCCLLTGVNHVNRVVKILVRSQFFNIFCLISIVSLKLYSLGLLYFSQRPCFVPI